MSGRLKSDSLGSKGTEKIHLPPYSQIARLPNNVGTVFRCKSCSRGHTVQWNGSRRGKADGPGPHRDSLKGAVRGPDQLSAHDCSHVGQMPQRGLAVLVEVSPGRGMRMALWCCNIVSWRESMRMFSMRMFSTRAQSHSNEWAWHTHSCSCETLASNMHRSPEMQVKRGHSWHLFYWKIHKEMLHKHYSKRSDQYTEKARRKWEETLEGWSKGNVWRNGSQSLPTTTQLGTSWHCPNYHIWAFISWSYSCMNVVEVLLKRAKQGPLVL